MKLSLAWIFEHIDAKWQTQSVEHIVSMFNQVTAEVERYWHVSYDLSSWAMASIKQNDVAGVEVEIPEWGIAAKLAARNDLRTLDKNVCFAVYRDHDNTIRWLSYADLNSEKTGLLPGFYIVDELLAGGWKEEFEAQDVILEVDNKSLTHRPDMWGHRGFAREIAAFLNLPFKPEAEFYEPCPLSSYDESSPVQGDMPIILVNQAPAAVKKFSGFYASNVSNIGSHPHIASRLLKLEQRIAGGIVDLTNYVMLDWSQPMHAFDAKDLVNSSVIVRHAKEGEELVLLDQVAVKLTQQDLVVADARKPLALAGIMGGAASSVGSVTNSIFVEAANFSPDSIRRSALRHKVRTEASARFEKNLDPSQTLAALQRFIFLAHKYGVFGSHSTVGPIVALGSNEPARVIVVEHAYFQARAGFALSVNQVVQPLSRIGFEVSVRDGVYTITVPSFRATKDIEAPEDILEEVIRFYGFNNIAPRLPAMVCRPRDLGNVMRLREIKRFFQMAARMVEQNNYSLLDEQLIERIDLQLKPDHLAIVNPISTQAYRLVHTLIPGLLKNIVENAAAAEDLRFFEVARVWHMKQAQVREQQKIAGILFNKRGGISFYACNQYIRDFYQLMNVEIELTKCSKQPYPWMSAYQTATIMHCGNEIGYVSKVDARLLAKLELFEEAEAFVFELDLMPILQAQERITSYVAPSKYQDSYFDLGFMVPNTLTVASLSNTLNLASSLVKKVVLLDFFEKEDWHDQRAVTFHVVIAAQDHVLVREEIEQSRASLIAAAQKLGATLRV